MVGWRRGMRFLGVIAAALVCGSASAGERSPFEGYRDLGEGRFAVQVDGEWYVPEAIAGIPLDEWLVYAVASEGVDWFEAVSEDLAGLVERRTGERVEGALQMTLRPVGGGAVEPRMIELTERKAEMASPSRRAVEEAMPTAPTWGVKRIQRAHAYADVSEVPSHLQRLVRRLPEGFGEPTPMLTRAQAERDLDQLEWLIENCHSYRTLRGYDYHQAFDAVRAGLGDGIPMRDFRLQLTQLLAGFGDGHSRVPGFWDEDLVGGYMPFTVREGRRRVLAVGPDGNAFDKVHTSIHSIDGVDIEYWAALGAAFVADGSTAFERPHSLWVVNWLRHLRAWEGRDPDAPVNLRLWTFDKQDPVDMTVELVDEAPERPADRPLFEHKVMGNNVGYLRIGTMRIAPGEVIERLPEDRRDRFISIDAINDAMGDLRSTDALVIDVRGNSGGDREIVNVLVPYFLDPNGGSVVVSAAQYRLRQGDKPDNKLGYLADRSMYPMAWDGWSLPERRAINNFREVFDPATDFAAPEEGFSKLHFMVVSPTDQAPWYNYTGQVVVLMDWYCFSATDVFLGAMKEMPNVTLVGQASGGGSGRAREYELAESGVRIKLSSMWSYLPTGLPYDTLGVAPDVPVNRELTDMLRTTDLLLERTVESLGGAVGPAP